MRQMMDSRQYRYQGEAGVPSTESRCEPITTIDDAFPLGKSAMMLLVVAYEKATFVTILTCTPSVAFSSCVVIESMSERDHTHARERAYRRLHVRLRERS